MSLHSAAAIRSANRPPLAQTALSPPRRRSAPRAPISSLDAPIPPRLLASPLLHDALVHHQHQQQQQQQAQAAKAKPTPRPAFSWLDQNEFSVPPSKPRAPPSPPASVKSNSSTTSSSSSSHRHKRTVSRVDIAVPVSPADLARPIAPRPATQLPSPPPTPPYRNIPIPQRLPPAPPVSSIPRALRCIDGKVLRSPIDLDRAATVRPV